MKLRTAFLYTTLLLVACDGENSTPIEDDAGQVPDGSNGEQDAGGTPEPDAAAPDAGAADCVVGDSADASFGPEGGSLSLCGATVGMAPGLLDTTRAVRLSVVALPEAAPFPLEAGGLAFDVEFEGDLPAASEPPLSVLLPHAETSHYKYFYRHDGENGYQQVEACTTEATSLGQHVYADGTFVVLVDREAFPTPSEQLGTGSMETTFDSLTSSFDLGSDSFDTYAIYSPNADGSRVVTLAATKPEGEDTLRMKVTFNVTAEGEGSIIEVSYGTLLGGLWGYLPFDPGAAEMAIDTNEPEHVAGSLEVEIRMGETTGQLSASFDARPGPYRFPPSLSCGSPPEG